MTELAGYTSRVSEMLDVFEDVNEGIYRRSADAEDALTTGDQAASVQRGQRVCGRLQIRGRKDPPGGGGNAVRGSAPLPESQACAGVSPQATWSAWRRGFAVRACPSSPRPVTWWFPVSTSRSHSDTH